MKVQAMHSAVAVRRQRHRVQEKRARSRKSSSGDDLDTPRDSVISIDSRAFLENEIKNKSMFGQVTVFHVGGVLIVIGLMLVITGLLPRSEEKKDEEFKKEVLGFGSVFIFIGCLLTTVSRFISNNEDRELNEYIQSRLERSKSGHRLLRENSGLPTPGRDRKFKTQTNGVSSHTIMTELSHSTSNLHKDGKREGSRSHSNVPPLKPHKSPAHEVKETNLDFPTSPSEEAILSKILEEEEVELDMERTDTSLGGLDSITDVSMTPVSPAKETTELLEKHRKVAKAKSSNSVKNTS